MLPLIVIILSRLDRGIQSATEMLPLKRGGTGLLHIVLTAPSRLHSSAANSSISVKFCVEAKAIFSEFQQWDRYSRSTERISCFLCISSSSNSSSSSSSSSNSSSISIIVVCRSKVTGTRRFVEKICRIY